MCERGEKREKKTEGKNAPQNNQFCTYVPHYSTKPTNQPLEGLTFTPLPSPSRTPVCSKVGVVSLGVAKVSSSAVVGWEGVPAPDPLSLLDSNSTMKGRFEDGRG